MSAAKPLAGAAAVPLALSGTFQYTVKRRFRSQIQAFIRKPGYDLVRCQAGVA